MRAPQQAGASPERFQINLRISALALAFALALVADFAQSYFVIHYNYYSKNLIA
jgi:hypothetical protein